LFLIHTLRFWLLLQTIGLLALPLTLRLLRFLPDRGYALARPLGLLLMGYLLWILVTIGVLRNTVGNTVFVLLLIAGASWLVWRKHGPEMLADLRRNRRLVIATEVLFLLALLLFATFRAYNPDIAATEKPMEFAFINGILRSGTFPPRDPWLSGYGISYYYLGYVIAAALTRLVGLASDITFNLVGSMLFALTVTGAFGVCANLALLGRREDAEGDGSIGAILTGALGAVLTAVMGNLEGLFEMIRAHGWGSEALWQWLDVKNLGTTPLSAHWYPDDMWWWWRASRVIHDKDLAGRSIEVIDEFPFFSFLLGDNHPHVLTLPFVFLALSLALNLLLSRRGEQSVEERSGVWARITRFLSDLWQGDLFDWVMYGLCLGSLGFLNTWDYPIYLVIAVACFAIARQRERGFGWAWLQDSVAFGAILLVMGIAFYMPFYVGFRSQAGGIGWVGDYKTRLHQFLLMMGVQVFLLSSWLVALALRWFRQSKGERTPLLAILLEGGCALAALLCAVMSWWTAALVLLLLGISLGLLVWGAQRDAESEPRLSASAQFGLLLAIVGLGLVGFCEFAFLRDTFGTRMNTVFKFYYQGWVLLSVAGAVGVFDLARRWRSSSRVGLYVWGGVATLLILCGLVYPVAAVPAKTNGFMNEPTLDGTGYIARYRPDDYAAVQWLRENAPDDAVMLEAPGGSYSEHNWVSAHTGIPTLLGWGGHELQWRGSYDIPSAREPDIEAIYTSLDAGLTASLLDQYGIDYVYVGRLERDRYHLNPSQLRKLGEVMSIAYSNESVTLYSRIH